MKKNKVLYILFFIIVISFGFSNNSIHANNEQLIIVNKKNNTLYFYENGKQTMSYRVATGKASSPTPEGTYKVNVKWKCPIYYATNKKGCASNNPLGTRWIGLSVPGTSGYTYGIHGTNDPSSIGKYASGGCVRSPKAELEKLFNKVKMNTKVVITNTTKTADTIAKEKGYKLNNQINKNQQDKVSTTQKQNNSNVVNKQQVNVKPKEEITKVSVKTHKVVKGDTLYSLSKKYKTTVANLTKWNNIKNNNIKIGQKLYVSKP